MSQALFFCISDNIAEINVLDNSQATEKKPNICKEIFLSEVKLPTNIKSNENIYYDDMDNIILANLWKENVQNENIETNNNETENINESTENTIENDISIAEENIKKAETNVTTSEIVNDGVNPKTTDEYNGVKINNATSYSLTEDMLNPNIEVNKNKIIIYHTHTCESYTPTEKYNYEQTGSYRTTDLNFTVARVGDELTNQLNLYGCQVIHDKTYHDYPAYTGSYSRSLVTAKNILENNQDADIVIDLHRDAIGDETYAPKVKIGEEYASQLMFVMGSNVANSINSNWNQNLKFAIKVQQKANELYPGLFKPIILRNSEYNQHVSKAACIIEVGATGNTLEESINSMKYLAKIIEGI